MACLKQKQENFWFVSDGHVIIAGEGLQCFTYTQHSWPLSSEGSLACHIYCDTGHPLMMVNFEDPVAER